MMTSPSSSSSTTETAPRRYGAERPAAAATLAARLTLHDGPLEFGWTQCGMTAEFLGALLASVAERASLDGNEVRHSIGYLANELLENAAKFRAPAAGDIVVEAGFAGSTFEVSVANFAAAETAARFQALVGELTARDPGEMLIERIEANAGDPAGGGSGLGFLTLMNDYGVRLGWTFNQARKGEPVRVEVHAALTAAAAA
jgi:hypothetical protein